MPRRTPLGVRIYCRLSARLLPLELREQLGRAVNETFYDLYREARAAPGLLARPKVLLREIRSLRSTARDERRRSRAAATLSALRSPPRTSTTRRSPEPCPSPRVLTMLDNVLQDIRFAFRSLAKSPLFTLVAVLTLSLGIGANTAVFSVVDGVLLAPLPYPEPDELAVVWTNFGEDLPQNWVSGPEFVEMRELNDSFETLAVAVPFTTAFTGRGEPEQVQAAVASGDFFAVLGVSAQLGRLLLPEDDVAGGDVRAIISDGLWRRRLGADPGALGQDLELGGRLATIVGILPPGFRVLHPEFTRPVDVWMPYQARVESAYQEMHRGSHGMRAFGRMRNGLSIEQAQADMNAVAARIAEITPDYYSFEGWGLTVLPLHRDVVEDVSGALKVLLGAVGFVLLIACVNVANLQLGRAAAREREISLRSALGANRRRIIQQLFTESLVLAVAGAAVGLLLATLVLRTLVASAAAYLPRLAEIAIDGRVLLFTLAAGLFTAIAFGIVPWLFSLRTSLSESLKEGGRGSTAGPTGSRARSVLVVAEVALAMVLLVGAGLMMRSFQRLAGADPGYRTDQILTLQLSLPSATYDADAQRAFWRDLLARVRGLGPVTDAALVSELPLSGAYASGTTIVDSSQFGQRHDGVPGIEADRRQVSEGYFETMGIEVIAGRTFTAADNRPDAEPVVVIDEEFARTFWPDGDPLAHRVLLRRQQSPSTGAPEVTWARIAGVVRHARHYGVGENGRQQVYFPVEQMPAGSMYLAIRTTGEPEALAGAIRERIWAIDPNRPLDDVATMQTRLADNVAQPRFNALLLGVMAALAATLAAIGLYGVVAFAVGQRTTEIGVRMALGASSGSVRTMILRQGLTLVAVGLVLGVATALGLARMIATLLYRVSAADPLTYASVGALLAAAATAACLVPATRATRVDPVAALREE